MRSPVQGKGFSSPMDIFSVNVYIILKCFNFYILFFVNNYFQPEYYFILGVRGEINNFHL